MAEAGAGSGASIVQGRPWWRRRWRLRTKLIAVSLILLASIAAGIGVVSYISMDSYLTRQLDEQLQRASQGARNFGLNRGPVGPQESKQNPSDLPSPRNPLEGPGQGQGFLMLRAVQGVVDSQASGWINSANAQQSLTDADAKILLGISPSDGQQTLDLSIGTYRVESLAGVYAANTVVVGLPMGSVSDTLRSLAITMVLVSLAGLIVSGFAGTLIIRRSLRPLEDVSHLANRVAALPLDQGEVTLVERTNLSDSETEVGQVGAALNNMLDNFENALAARQESETKVRQFVADASHELRTPLTSIRGYSDLVAKTQQLDAAGIEQLDRVRSQAMRMQNLVDDLLLLARYDEGRESKMVDVDLTELIIEAASDAEVSDSAVSTRAGVAPHQWNISVPEEPVVVRGDEVQLQRTFANLLSNAKKHTPPGTRVSVELSLESGESAMACVRIADNGGGIPADFLPKIFDRFARADAARSGADGTTGLGLPIVKAIINAHAGEIAVSSSAAGTVFTLKLPH